MARNVLVHGGAKLSHFIIVFILLSTLLVSLPTVAAAEWGHGDGQFQYPTGIAADSEGNVYVADSGNYRIQKFNSNGGFETKWGEQGYGQPSKFSWPMDVAISSGYVYIVDMYAGVVQKFNSDGEFDSMWGGSGQFYMPQGIAVDSSGNVYVADTYNKRIRKFDSSGTHLMTWPTGGGDYDYPNGIAVDSSGNVFVAIWNYIQKFDSSGIHLKTWYCYGAVDVDVDPEGNVYVAISWDDYWGNNHTEIKKFDSEGAYITHWGSEGTDDGQFKTPAGIAIDSSGNVYVADTGNCRIQKFTSAGQFIDYIPPLNQPPVAEAGDNQTAIVGEEITFNGSNSSDVDGTIESYKWDFGDTTTDSGAVTTHSYSSNGTYTVTLTVTDDDGATDNDTTIVTVQTPAEALQDLILYVEEMSLPRGIEKSLTSKIEAAISSLNRGQENAAANQLHAFINEVEAQRGKEITDMQADELIAKVQQVIDNI